MIRIGISVVPAVMVVFSLFWILQGMINVASTPLATNEKLQLVDFIRLKKEQTLIKKERIKPQKPKPQKKPPRPKVDIKKDIKIAKQPLLHENIDIDLPIDLSAVNALGDAMVSGFGSKEVNASVLPLSRIDPIYPKRAKMMKQEGYVKLEFTITTFGTVKEVEVVESDPPNLFDTCATRALLKWKFKPKKEENKTVEQRAMIQIDFRLN